jgi:hypothetical protein
MQPEGATADQARALFAKLSLRLDDDPYLARRVLDALNKAAQPRKSSNRRTAAVLDPGAVYRQDPAALRPALTALSLDQLKDVVSQYAMDPRRLAMKWRTPERLIELIVTVTEHRASKGNAFRS